MNCYQLVQTGNLYFLVSFALYFHFPEHHGEHPKLDRAYMYAKTNERNIYVIMRKKKKKCIRLLCN